MPLTGVVIVVVDDEPAIRSLVTTILQRQGASVHAAASGHEAQQCVASLPRVDVLLTDVVLPDIAGPDLARALLARYPAMRVIVMSGYLPDQVTQLTGSAFLQKPFEPAALRERVRDALQSPG